MESASFPASRVSKIVSQNAKIRTHVTVIAANLAKGFQRKRDIEVNEKGFRLVARR